MSEGDRFEEREVVRNDTLLGPQYPSGSRSICAEDTGPQPFQRVTVLAPHSKPLSPVILNREAGKNLGL